MASSDGASVGSAVGMLIVPGSYEERLGDGCVGEMESAAERNARKDAVRFDVKEDRGRGCGLAGLGREIGVEVTGTVNEAIVAGGGESGCCAQGCTDEREWRRSRRGLVDRDAGVVGLLVVRGDSRSMSNGGTRSSELDRYEEKGGRVLSLPRLHTSDSESSGGLCRTSQECGLLLDSERGSSSGPNASRLFKWLASEEERRPFRRAARLAGLGRDVMARRAAIDGGMACELCEAGGLALDGRDPRVPVARRF